MSDLLAIEDELLSFIAAELDVPSGRCGPTTPLFSDGLLDSFSMVTLLVFVEERWGVSLLDADVAVATLDSVRTLAAHVHATAPTLPVPSGADP